MSFHSLHSGLLHHGYVPAVCAANRDICTPYRAYRLGSPGLGAYELSVYTTNVATCDPSLIMWGGPWKRGGQKIPVSNRYPLWARVADGEALALNDYLCLNSSGHLVRKNSAFGVQGRAGFQALEFTETTIIAGTAERPTFALITLVQYPVITSSPYSAAMGVTAGGEIATLISINKTGTWTFHVSATVSADTTVNYGTSLEMQLSKNGSPTGAKGVRSQAIERDNYNTYQATTAENVAFTHSLHLNHGDVVKLINSGTAATDYTNIYVTSVFVP